MEKRSRRRVPDLVARPAFQGLSENEIGRARISMMARNTSVPFKGRIQKRKTYDLQIITFGLQRAAGPYRWARSGHSITSSAVVNNVGGNSNPSDVAALRLSTSSYLVSS